MDREHDEAVLRITASYVAEVQAGRQPRVSDYLLRYPQYANAIVDFVIYFHALEGYELEEGALEGFPPEIADMALARVKLRLFPLEPVRLKPLTTLLVESDGLPLTLSQLAAALEVSEDISLLLERRSIRSATLPEELLRRVSRRLRQPLNAVSTYFAALEYGGDEPGKPVSRIAENRARYPSEVERQPQRCSFREAVEASPQLSHEQKARWDAILKREGLE